MSDSWQILIVGVDFGTTGTAVAYATPADNKIHQLRKWPDDLQTIEKDKVPTMAAFEGNNVAAWGFGVKHLSPEDIPNFAYYKLFKPHFDSADITLAAEAERCVRVFLRELRKYIEQALRDEKNLKGLAWEHEDFRIKYVFSYPTTWGPATQRRFSRLVQDAGYLPTDEQQLMTSLDEAQASVVQFLSSDNTDQESFPKPDDLILVADIGGGTSDVGIFKVLGLEGRKPQLVCKAKDEGKETGSAFVDDLCRDKLRVELKKAYQKAQHATSSLRDLTETDIDTFVNAAVFHLEHDQTYLNQKHNFGQRVVGGRVQPTHFPLWFPDLATAMSKRPREQLGKKSLISIDIHKDTFFDEAFLSQCDKIWKQCEEQMKKLDDGQTIRHIVLAGGFGSSPFIVKHLSDHFKANSRSKDAIMIEIRDAQLAASRGLVQSELWNIHGSPGWVYPAAFSYGIQKGMDKDGVKWFLQQGEDIKVPHHIKISRQVDIDPNNFILQLVRTPRRPVRLLIPNEDEKTRFRSSINPVSGVNIDKWIKESLSVGLKADFSLLKTSKKATVTIEGYLSRDAIRFTLEQGGVTHGHPLILLQDWHGTPKTRTAKVKESTLGPRAWKWGIGDTVAAVGVGFGAVAAIFAGVALWNDLRKKPDPTRPSSPGNVEEGITAGPSIVETPADDHDRQTEGDTGVGPERDAKAATEQRAP